MTNFFIYNFFYCSYLFLVNEWLSRDKGSHQLFTSFGHTKTFLQEGHILFSHFVEHKTLDDILLLSLFLRRDYSTFTRVQRLYSLASILALSLLTSAMWYTTDKGKPSYGVKLGSVTINYKQIFTGVMSAVIVVPPIFLLIMFFKSYKRRRNEEEHKPEGESDIHYPNVSKVDQSEKYPLPWCFCVVAWILTLAIILGSAFLIFMYSLQWGGDVANEWLMSILFGLLFNCVSSPLKVGFQPFWTITLYLCKEFYHSIIIKERIFEFYARKC